MFFQPPSAIVVATLPTLSDLFVPHVQFEKMCVFGSSYLTDLMEELDMVHIMYKSCSFDTAWFPSDLLAAKFWVTTWGTGILKIALFLGYLGYRGHVYMKCYITIATTYGDIASAGINHETTTTAQ